MAALTLRARLIIFYLALGLIPILAGTAFMLDRMEDTIIKQATRDLEGRRDSKLLSLERWFETRIANVSMLSDSRIVVDLVNEYEAIDLGSPEAVNATFEESVARYGDYMRRFTDLYGFEDIFVIDLTGRILYANVAEQLIGRSIVRGELSDGSVASAFSTAVEAGDAVTDMVVNQRTDGRAVMYIASRIDEEGMPQGVVVGRLPRETLRSIMTERAGLGETGDAYLVAEDGLARSDLTFGRSAQGETDVLISRVQSEAVSRALAGNAETLPQTDYRGAAVIASFTDLDIPGLDWALVVKVDENEILQPVQSLRNSLIIFIAFAAAIILALSFFLADAISVPILRLTQQVQRIARGDLTERITEGREDEIGQLSVALNEVVDTERALATTALRIAEGDFSSAELIERGEADQLGTAINQMVDTLSRAARQAAAVADGDYAQDVTPASEKDALGTALERMTASLRASSAEQAQQRWLQGAIARINDVVLGEEDVQQLAQRVIEAISELLDARVGAFYTVEDTEEPRLTLMGTYAYTKRKNLSSSFAFGESLVGQAALERQQILISSVPEDYIRVTSGLGDAIPTHVCVTPFIYENRVLGVIEVATLGSLNDQSLTFLDRIAPAVATAFEVAQSRSALREQQGALQASNEELSAQSERLLNSQQELEKQQRALERSNRELEEQAKELAASEAELQRQQASLEVANADLERNNAALETQKEQLDSIRINAEAQAEALARSNRAQSDFTNRLSHELRTPLNSILLISKSLAGNRDKNLTDAQTRELDMIHESGSNLLDLINEILDHSKIEAGRLEVRPALARVSELARLTRDQFSHMAADQHLEFEVDVADSAPPEIVTDAQRLMQVIKNLVSNALKFTTEGGVFVRFAALDNEQAEQLGVARRGDEMLLTVRDSGIGIAEDQQALIFDAFRQVDSGDSRRYGGTGLGLNITKQLIGLLGGSISVKSTPEVGSTFYVVLPAALAGAQEERALPSAGTRGHFIEAGHRDGGLAALPEPLFDERDLIDDESSVILVIEDDRHFAELLQKEVRSEGFMTLLALDGEAGIALAREFEPKGVLLDLQLPRMDGWSVLQALKADLQTRHIPVHIISVEERTPRGLNMGAIGHLTKPVQPEDITQALALITSYSNRSEKWVLLVEDDERVRLDTARAIGNDTVSIKEVSTGAEALEALGQRDFDLIVLDLGLPDMRGVEMLDAAVAQGIALPPVIVNTVSELSEEQEMKLREYSESIIVKDVRSHERLIDEVALFLHRVVAELPEDKRSLISHMHSANEPLQGKTVLIAEDDMRTLFVMTKVLAEQGLIPIKAENGLRALEIARERSDIDIFLMDIMMPLMDGYEAISALRELEAYGDTPIIALTAKAMKEDRARCLEAGASDYLSKPVEQNTLLSLMRVWLSKR